MAGALSHAPKRQEPLCRAARARYTQVMRTWLFHPLVFYPLAILFAAGVIAFSLRPQSWPREPAAVAATIADDGALIFEGEAFDSPSNGPEQELTVIRDAWGKAQTLRIAQLPGQPLPTPADQGAQLLLTPDQAATIEDQPVLVEVTYNPLPVNAASALAVSLQGAGPVNWVQLEAPPQPGVLRFELPPQIAVNAIGLRALSDGEGQAFGLEIVRIRVVPLPPSAAEPSPAPATPTTAPAN
jgi:hypothetical protein